MKSSGKLPTRPSFLLALGVACAWGVVLACSTASLNAPVLDDADVDAAVAEVVAVDDVASDAGLRACRVGIPEPPPRWVPSHPFHRPLCTSEEVSTLVACLGGSDDAACDTFRAAHAECFSCAFTDHTDSVYGANVVYREDNYRLVNFGGCMGNRTTQTGADGCGAAAALFDQCRTRACHSCMPVVGGEGDEGLAALGQCASNAEGSTYCAAQANRLARACNNALSPEPPEDPYEFCNLSTEGYIRLFCTALPDGGDGGLDAGDAD